MSHSPYAYVRNNPVNFSDIMGLYGDYYDGYDDYDDNGGPIWDWIRDLFNGDGFVNGRDGYIGTYENGGGNYSHGNNDEGYYDEDEWEQFERWIEENLQDLDFGEDPMQEIGGNNNASPSSGSNGYGGDFNPNRSIFLPVAISVSVGADLYPTAGGEGEAGILFVFAGPDSGRFGWLFEYGTGLAIPYDASAGIEITLYFYSGDVNNLTIMSFEGDHQEYAVSYSFGTTSTGVGLTISEDAIHNERIVGLQIVGDYDVDNFIEGLFPENPATVIGYILSIVTVTAKTEGRSVVVPIN